MSSNTMTATNFCDCELLSLVKEEKEELKSKLQKLEADLSMLKTRPETTSNDPNVQESGMLTFLVRQQQLGLAAARSMLSQRLVRPIRCQRQSYHHKNFLMNVGTLLPAGRSASTSVVQLYPPAKGLGSTQSSTSGDPRRETTQRLPVHHCSQ